MAACTPNRRELLGSTFGAAALAGLSLPLARAAQPTMGGGIERARNIIFMVSDGMSMGVPSLAEPFSRLVRGRGTHWTELLGDARCSHGWQETASLNSLVTDSSAASSAWGSGARVFNDAVNMLPDGTRLTTIAELARAAGRRVGLVTTTTITHATPAGFAAVQARRDDEADIAPQYLDRVDVLMGGGREFFLPELRKDRRNLAGEFRQQGYALWSKRDQVIGPDRPERVLGLFNSGHLPFTIDRDNDESIQQAVPTLAEMTAAALDLLAKAPRGFLLQVEGGRVDHAAHGNDAAALLWDQLAFDDAMRVVTDFARAHPDTLVVITTDHGNSNPGLNGTGPNYRDTTACFERLARFKASFEVIGRRLTRGLADGASPELDRTIETLREATGIALSRDEATLLADAIGGRLPPEISRQHKKLVGISGQLFGNHTGIGWTGVSHTADLALVTALGPGREAFCGVRPNTDAFVQMTAALGVKHRNPSMTTEEAKRFASANVGRHLAGEPGPIGDQVGDQVRFREVCA